MNVIVSTVSALFLLSITAIVYGKHQGNAVIMSIGSIILLTVMSFISVTAVGAIAMVTLGTLLGYETS